MTRSEKYKLSNGVPGDGELWRVVVVNLFGPIICIIESLASISHFITRQQYNINIQQGETD